MYFTHCFQISFILKNSNLKFSALCLDSTDCICLVCPTPRSSLSLMRNVWLGKPLILPVSSPYEPKLPVWGSRGLLCKLNVTGSSLQNTVRILELLAHRHCSLSLASAVVCSVFPSDSRLETVLTQTLPSGITVTLGALGVCLQHILQELLCSQGWAERGRPSPSPSAPAASSWVLFLLTIHLLVWVSLSFTQLGDTFSGCFHLLTQSCKYRARDAPQYRTSAFVHCTRVPSLPLQNKQTRYSQLLIVYIIYIFYLSRVFCPFELFSISQHD